MSTASHDGARFPARTITLWACLSGAAFAQTSQAPLVQTSQAPSVQSVTIEERHYDNAVGSSDAASQGIVRAELLKSRPAMRPGEVLEFVPGVMVTQHSGDGKANQYFLRGFNLDHGTDFATSINGMPVNMPTHAHGQGYTDLNFLIPELVQRIDYRKGPYFAASGDFSLAGAADINYRRSLDHPFAALTVGPRGYQRALLGGSSELSQGITALAVFEAMGNNGPWTVPENLKRVNAVLGLSGGSPAAAWQVQAMSYNARWTATDQIPANLIGKPNPLNPSRLFGRFDSLDPSDGGNTSRSSLSAQFSREEGTGSWKASAYVIRYSLDLFSNFEYLRVDDDGSTRSAQFEQQDQRTVTGGAISRVFAHELGQASALSEVGLQVRNDRIRVGRFDTRQRMREATGQLDNVQQTLLGLYGQTALQWQPWLRTVAGLRADSLQARVKHIDGPDSQSGSASKSLVSPKLSVIAGPFSKAEVFLNAGQGFHSNDARGAVAGSAAVPLLVPGTGYELGARTEAVNGLQSSLALWALRLKSELVYAADDGTTQPQAASRRQGVEFNNRYTPNAWLLLDADLAWSRARFDDGSYVPNAVEQVASLAATVRQPGNWSASVQLRHLGSGPLNDDNSVRSSPSVTTNLRLARRVPEIGRNSELLLDVFNVFDRKVNDIQYYDVSYFAQNGGLQVHPAEPRSLRLTLRVGL